jgi:predicted ATP-dependent Lon-type protease
LLDGRSKGSFLVRLSAKSDKYVIVWMSDNKQKVHILVDSVDNGDPTQRFKVDTKHSAVFFSNLPAVIQEYLKKKHLTSAVPCTPDLSVFDPALRRHKEQTAK